MVFEIFVCLLLIVTAVGIIDLVFFNSTIQDTIASLWIKTDQVYYIAKGDVFSPEFDFEKDVYFAIPREIVKGKKGKGLYVVFDVKSGTGSAEFRRAGYTIKAINFATSFKKFK